MGILNVTADSFSDGGRWLHRDDAVAHGLRMREQGADWIDVGGESTRPGADPVPAAAELERVMPVVEALVAAGVPVSVDTMKPEVMRAAIAAGCAIVNDVNAFQARGAVEAVAGSAVGLVAMHMQGEPRTMQQVPRYADVTAEVCDFLRGRAEALEAAGIASHRIALDPGFGFGKSREHNIALFRELPRLAALGYPVLVGVSRKRMIGHLVGRDDIADRVVGSVAAALAALEYGSRILRVHDVRETVDAINVWMELR